MTNLLTLPQSAKKSSLGQECLNKLKKFEKISWERRGERSKRYKYVDTAQIEANVGHYLTSLGYEYKSQIIGGASEKSSMHILSFTLTNMDLLKGTGDHMNGRILILNSYNAECSLTVIAGAIRFACANGLIAGEKEYFERLRHIEGETIRNGLMMLNEKVYAACEWLKNTFSARITTMKNLTLTYAQEAEIVFKLNLPDAYTATILKTLHPNNAENLRKEDRERDSWRLYNVINEIIREKSRSDMGEFEKNQSLMHDVIEYAQAA